MIYETYFIAFLKKEVMLPHPVYELYTCNSERPVKILDNLTQGSPGSAQTL